MQFKVSVTNQVYAEDPEQRPLARVSFSDAGEHPYTVEITVLGIEHPVVSEIRVENMDGVSPRDVKRLPLATYAQAAIVAVRDWDMDAAARTLTAPRGRPRKGQGMAFYRELAGFYRELVRSGVRHPAKEIARRKRVSQNLVHQWVFRARELGLLESPPGRKARER